MLNRAIAALLLTAACGMGFAESLEQRVKATDMNDAESVFSLAEWCRENNLPSKARTYYNLTVKLNKDHDGARAALGQVRVGDRWVAANAAPAAAGAKKGEGAAAAGEPPARQPTGTAPTADQIVWDLKLPTDPEPLNTWINTYIDKLPTVGNDSDDMAVAVATMLQPEQLPRVIPRLCKKLTEPTFTDLYGTSDVINELVRAGKMRQAKTLLPFLVKASERSNEPGDLAAFAFAVGQLKDKRVVPRLLQLLESDNAETKDGAANGLQLVTLLPLEQITPARVKQWWSLNYNTTDQQIYQEQLRSSDPRVAIEAATALYEYRDRTIVPVLTKLMRGDDMSVRSDAISLIQRITGNDWTYDPSAPADERKKRADEIDKWWKEEQFRFVWIEDRGKVADAVTATAAPTDPAEEWVKQLGSATATEATSAESNLKGAGPKAVPALITGLEDANRLVQRKCHGLLEQITKQKLPFDPSGTPEVRAAQIEAWRGWAIKEKLITEAPEGGEGAEEAHGDGEEVKPKKFEVP